MSTPPPAAPPHPNFWWALLWCVFLVLATQVPGAVVAVAVLTFLVVRDPRALQNLSGPAVGIAVAVAVFVAHGLIILLSLIVLRVTAGRHWPRLVAVRVPALSHVVLTLALLPAFLTLGSGLALALKRLGYPSVTRPPFEVGAFWGAVVVVVLCAGVVRLIGGGWTFSSGTKSLLSAVALATMLGAGVGAYFALLPVMADLLPATADLTSINELMEAITSLPPVVAVLMIGVFPGVSEELWCRAFLGRGLVGRYGAFWGVLLASALFGAIHGDPLQATYALCMGAVLHVVYLWSRSLLTPMLLHFLNNACSVTLTRVSSLKALDDGERGVPWLLLGTSAACLAACLAAFWYSRARLVGDWRPEYPGVECPPNEATQIVAGEPAWAVGLVAAGSLAAYALALGWTLTAQ